MFTKTLTEGEFTAVLWCGSNGDHDDPRSFMEPAGNLFIWDAGYAIGDDAHGTTHESYLRTLLNDNYVEARDKVITYAIDNGYMVQKTSPPGTLKTSDDYFDYWDIYQGWREVNIEGNPENEMDECWDHLTCEAEIHHLHEFLEATDLFIYYPLFLLDAGSNGMELRTWHRREDEEPDGILYLEKEKIVELYGALPLTDYFLKKAEKLILSELETYNHWLNGDVYELQIRDKSDIVIDASLSYGYENYRDYVKNYDGPHKDLVQRVDDDGEEDYAA